MIRSRLLKHFFVYYLRVVAVLAAGVIVLAYVAVFTEFARQAGGSPTYTLAGNLLVSALKMPFLVQSIMPFIVLFGSMASLILLNRAGELVVARTAGLSAWQFVAPLCVASFLMGVAAVVILNPASARAAATAQQLERAIRDGRPETATRAPERWTTERSETGLMAIGASGLAANDGRLSDVTVLQFDANRRFVARFDARDATLDTGALRLQTARRLNASGEREVPQDIEIATRLTPDHLARQFSTPDSAHVFELPALIRAGTELGLPANAFATRLHALIALPFLLVGMTLIAAAVSMRFSRTGQSTISALAGIAAGFLFFVVSTVATAAADAGALAPVVAGWLPVTLAICFSVVSLLHTEDG